MEGWWTKVLVSRWAHQADGGEGLSGVPADQREAVVHPAGWRPQETTGGGNQGIIILCCNKKI